MSTHAGTLFARDAEVAGALEVLTGDDGGAVALVGTPGIGKSALLDSVTQCALDAGLVVRRTSGAVAEIGLPFVGLHDLFADDLASDSIDLPANLHAALDIALVRAQPPDTGADLLALNLGVVGVIEQLSDQRRLLIALDDLQWLDAPTRASLSFALRRLPRARVSVLAAMRPDTVDLVDLAPGEVRTVPVGPLDDAALAAIVERRTGSLVPRRLATSLHDLSGGNPLLALELVRGSGTDPEALRELSVPERHRAILGPRLEALSADARHALLAAALLSRPSIDEVGRVAPVDGLVEAESAGVVRLVDGGVVFSHPLFAALCRELASPSQRRELHGLLAQAADDETERARHLGAATLTPDDEVSARIHKAAGVARDRAAIATAADLGLLAARLTPKHDPETRIDRYCEAARLFFQAGDGDTAIRFLDPLLAEAEPGPSRARLLVARVDVVEQDIEGAGRLLEEALSQPGLDDGFRIELRIALLDQSGFSAIQVEGPGADLERQAEAAGRADLAARCRWEQSWAEFMGGRPVAGSAVWHRMLADAESTPLRYEHPLLLEAWEAVARDDHDKAAALIDGLLSRARLAGNLPLEGALTLHLSEVETRRGRLGAAVDLAERGVRICTDGRYDQMPLFVLAHAIAWQGHTDDARRIATTALAMAEEAGDGMYEPVCHIMLGFVDASEGRYDDAAPHFARAAELFDRLGWRQPGVLKWHADAVETYLALDRYDDAAAVTERLAAEADRLSYATSQALAARCRAMLLAHTGDLDAAETEVMHSLELTDGFDVPLDTARTLLVSGVIHRRLRQKAVAREELRRARALFGDRGAALWAARADRELERSAAAASGQQLTSSERSAAVLAASGVTNREIAGRLFISTKTVEAVLTRVYRKLGVRSRTELAHHPDLADGDPTQGLAQGPAQGPA